MARATRQALAALLLLLLPAMLAAFKLPCSVSIFARLRDTCAALAGRPAAARKGSLPVWKMQLSGRQQYYLEQEQVWERELDAACPAAVVGVGAGARACAHCAAELTSGAVACGQCAQAHVAFCDEACLRAAWGSHKFACSAHVEVRRSQTSDGLGVFARRAFAAGEELVRERPLVVLADQEFEAKGETYLTGRVAGLPPLRRDAVLQLADVYNEPATAVGVVQTNTLPVDAQSFGGLFALGCRINHSCRPNACFKWRDDLGCGLVLAMRPIALQEEVTIAYREGFAPRHERRALLKQLFKFDCACELCSSPSEDSDANMVAIQDLLDEIGKTAMLNPQLALIMSQKTQELLHEEGLDNPVNMVTIFYDAYQLAATLGDRDAARVYLDKMLESAVLAQGETSPLVAQLRDKFSELS